MYLRPESGGSLLPSPAHVAQCAFCSSLHWSFESVQQRFLGHHGQEGEFTIRTFARGGLHKGATTEGVVGTSQFVFGVAVMSSISFLRSRPLAVIGVEEKTSLPF